MRPILTKPLANIFPAIREEVDNALSIELPLSKGKRGDKYPTFG